MPEDRPSMETKLSSLHTLLWHLRDEMGNKRGKAQLTLAIGLIDDMVLDVREGEMIGTIKLDKAEEAPK